jgi:hypothetical protein
VCVCVFEERRRERERKRGRKEGRKRERDRYEARGCVGIETVGVIERECVCVYAFELRGRESVR